MRFTVQLAVNHGGPDEGTIAQETIEIALLEWEGDPSLEDLGLTLTESKDLLRELQRRSFSHRSSATPRNAARAQTAASSGVRRAPIPRPSAPSSGTSN